MATAVSAEAVLEHPSQEMGLGYLMSGCLGKNTNKGGLSCMVLENNTNEVMFARRETVIEALPGKGSSGLEIK